jgi:CheY-like chemotaxis protein
VGEPLLVGVAFLNEALRRIPGVPAIILTGNVGAANAQGLEKSVGGRVSLVRKPVSGAALAAATAELIRP